MWHEIRADRTLVEVMAGIPPCGPGRGHGSDLQEPGHALSLNAALRYLTAASMATQRAQRAFFQHRRAKRDCLLVPAPPEVGEPPANQNGTNELPVPRLSLKLGTRPARTPCAPASTACSPARDRESPRKCDLVAAIRAAKLPGAAPYRGPIDPDRLDRLLAERRFDDAGLAWLASLRPAHAEPERMAVAAPG